ncbi:MAG: hypothetical protein WBV33_17785, partial [Terracidiphilus sp.]
ADVLNRKLDRFVSFRLHSRYPFLKIASACFPPPSLLLFLLLFLPLLFFLSFPKGICFCSSLSPCSRFPTPYSLLFCSLFPVPCF